MPETLQPKVASSQQLIRVALGCTVQRMVVSVEKQKMEFAQRLRQALDHAGIPDDRQRRGWVAKTFGVSVETARKWLVGESIPATKRIPLIAERLGVRGEWLLTGQGPMLEEPRHSFSGANTTAGARTMGMVPLISWVAAGAWTEAVDPYTVGDAEKWMPCPAPHSEHTFALTVRGLSMYNPNGKKSYAPGDIIYVDPMVQPENGHMVVVRLDDENEATFKQLIIEGDRHYLAALNPSWPEQIIEINGHSTIAGVVIGKWVPE